jgi:tRNA threonylcarbamoyl adenosine modification protein YeaZ
MSEPAVGPRLVLGLDTSTLVHVGLARGTEVLATATVEDRMAHVEQLTPLVRRVVEEAGVALADLDLVVVGLGPGPFTGLRVGVVTARVLAAALGPALRGVCSLDVIAAQHAATFTDGEFLVATDARRREVYWARYAADGTRSGGPEVSAPSRLPRLPVVGPAADLYAGEVSAVDGPRMLDPGTLAVRGPRMPDAGVEPLYLRRPDATEPGRPKSVSTFRAGAR